MASNLTLSPLPTGRHFTPPQLSAVYVSRLKRGGVLRAKDGDVYFYFWLQIMRQSQPHPGLVTLEEGRESCPVLCIRGQPHSHFCS